MKSSSRSREQAYRLEDDLAMLQAERQASTNKASNVSRSKPRFLKRNPDSRDEHDDIDSGSSTRSASIYRPPNDPNTSVGKVLKKIYDSFWPLPYFLYITPLVLMLLIPLLLGAFLFQRPALVAWK
jgi:hypothetical protein